MPFGKQSLPSWRFNPRLLIYCGEVQAIKLSRKRSTSIKAFSEVPHTMYRKLLGIRDAKITEILFKARSR